MTTQAAPSKTGWLIILSGLVTAISVTLLLVDSRAQAGPAVGRAVPGTDRAVANLEARVASLEREVALLRGLLTSGGAQVQPLSIGAASDLDDLDRAAFADRLQRLEDVEGARQQLLSAELAEEALDDERDRARDVTVRDRAHEIILDPSRTDEEKVRAWRDIRKLDVDAWTDDIVLEMLAVARSDDPEIREDVWKGADGKFTNSLLLEPLVMALTSDPDKSVREQAADALSRYLDQPGVREALRQASELDLHEDVRGEALKSLLDS